jgi:hypothetical protein
MPAGTALTDSRPQACTDSAPQALVLADSRKARVRHLLVHREAGMRAQWRAFLLWLQREQAPTWRGDTGLRPLQTAFGLTWQGLQMEGELAGAARRAVHRLAPAFTEGAAQRAAAKLGDDGWNAATGWLPAFAAPSLLGVVTLMHHEAAPIDAAAAQVRQAAHANGLRVEPLPDGIFLGAPHGGPGEQWVHFGLRDGISSVPFGPGEHEVPWGELLLGEPREAGNNPWKLVQAQDAVQRLFHHAAFGALRMVEQDVVRFEAWVRDAVERLRPQWPADLAPPKDWNDWLKSRLCGRWPDGGFSRPDGTPGTDLTSPGADPDGTGCPFGSHVRRMNPGVAAGGARPVHGRLRVLVRCGRAYGAANWDGTPDATPVERGLMGHFFCASLEDQFEHLLGQWADRVPLGLPDRGNAKDPLIGAHHDTRRCLDIPLPGGRRLRLDGFRPFVRTRGTAYLLYLSERGLHTLLHDRDLIDPRTEEPRP